MVYFSSQGFEDRGNCTEHVSAWNSNDGALLWDFKALEWPDNTLGPFASNAILTGSETLVVVENHTIYAFDADGSPAQDSMSGRLAMQSSAAYEARSPEYAAGQHSKMLEALVV